MINIGQASDEDQRATVELGVELAATLDSQMPLSLLRAGEWRDPGAATIAKAHQASSRAGSSAPRPRKSAGCGRSRMAAASVRVASVQCGSRCWRARKPWQNMRVSRATELADVYPSHVCAAWLGHSEKIADAFYRQVTDEHFAKAVRNPVRGGGASGRTDPATAPENRIEAHENEGFTEKVGEAGFEPAKA